MPNFLTLSPQPQAQSSDCPASVYRYYDDDGMLIYVGMTKRGVLRNFEHAALKEWWPFVSKQEVDHYPSCEAALSAERLAIQTYRPPFNHQHNIDYQAMHGAYLRLRQQPLEDVEERGLDLLAGGRRLDLSLSVVDLPDKKGRFTLRSEPEDCAIAQHLVLKSSVPVHHETDGVHVATIKRLAVCGPLVYAKAELKKRLELPEGEWIITVNLDTSKKPLCIRIKKAVIR